MKSWRIHEFGPFREKLKLEELPTPKPIGTESVLRVRAIGLNFPDLLAISGGYQMKPDLPFTPGMEFSGEVVEAGPESPFRKGERVMSMYLGGGFAEYATVQAETCYRMPEGMSFEDAAAFQVTYQTSYFALVHRAQLKKDEVLLVHGGAGGVGTTAIQLGKWLGARVIATAGSAAKLEVCKEAGADEVIDYSKQDFVEEVKRLTDGHGADVIYDPVGGDVFDKSTKCIAWEGRLVVIGFASGRIPSIAANRILLKNISIVGLQWGAYKFQNPKLCDEAQTALVQLYRVGRFRPVLYPTRFSLEQVPDALAALEGRSSYGKVLVIP
jgi:NADPH2:quinone reductase